MPMHPRDLRLPALMLLGALGVAPAFAADEDTAPKGAAVTVFKAAKLCFGNIVEVSGSIIAREEDLNPTDDANIRSYYQEWRRRMGKSPATLA